MEPVFARTKFSKPIYEKAARDAGRDRRRRVLAHRRAWRCTTSAATATARSSRARSSRSIRSCGCREENLYLRYEDTVVVTETGVENFTDFIPMELDDMEKLVLEKGIVQKFPPVAASGIRRGTR